METSERILNEAQDLLIKGGPSLMNMDIVARNCGISKRTLYEIYPDKLSLIRKCIEHEQEEHSREFQLIYSNSDNCFEAMFKIYWRLREYLKSSIMAFAGEIKRQYPELFRDHIRKQQEVTTGLSHVFSKAQTEGHVIKGLNTRLAAYLFLTTMRNISDDKRLNDEGFDQAEVFDVAFTSFLRGIATTEGINLIEKLTQENQTDNKNKQTI
ncbi:MAG: TetR/AcrR family transcriptional regulator [Muribaculaceae bacterium]|nr:TetR/AcrR family transcriptional regulator [Muribaculaceae bacterium]